MHKAAARNVLKHFCITGCITYLLLRQHVCVCVCVQRTQSWHGGQQWSPRRHTDQLRHGPLSPSVHELKPGSVVNSSPPPAAAARVNRAVTTTTHGTPVSQATSTHSPASYRTMYVCNIGDCNRGFAYKKNLVTHQRTKHSCDH